MFNICSRNYRYINFQHSLLRSTCFCLDGSIIIQGIGIEQLQFVTHWQSIIYLVQRAIILWRLKSDDLIEWPAFDIRG